MEVFVRGGTVGRRRSNAPQDRSWWVCKECGFRNKPYWGTCEKCNEPRGA